MLMEFEGLHVISALTECIGATVKADQLHNAVHSLLQIDRKRLQFWWVRALQFVCRSSKAVRGIGESPATAPGDPAGGAALPRAPEACARPAWLHGGGAAAALQSHPGQGGSEGLPPER